MQRGETRRKMTIVFGVPGAGKSSVLSAISGKTEYALKNYGDLMFEIAKRRKLVKDRDEIRALEPSKQQKIQAEVGKMLARMKGKVVLDTHCSISTPNGFLPGLPMRLLKGLGVSQLVLITAPVEEIIERRKKDAERRRDDETPESIRLHHEMNLALLAAYSFYTGAPAKIIVNRQGELEKAQREFMSLIE